jgi:hypothetical protein
MHCIHRNLVILFLLCSFSLYEASSQDAIVDIGLPIEITLMHDPPNRHSSVTLLGVFVRSNDPDARIYYDDKGNLPTLSSPYCTYKAPHIQLDTPFKGSRVRNLVIIAVSMEGQTPIARSEQYELEYYVEGAARPDGWGFLVPGVQSGGYFVKFRIEQAASARAQVAGSQEFADFFNKLGIGPYDVQLNTLKLTDLDPDLNGFEGGFAYNVTNGGSGHYGILVPYNTGARFYGKVVRVDLQRMSDLEDCVNSYRQEAYDANFNLVVTGSATIPSAVDACILVLDVQTKHPMAVGFMRGFVGYPYGYLSPGQFNVLLRLDLENMSLETTRIIDLGLVDQSYGGYSGGFVDGTWACFNPFRSFTGAVGGIRSELQVDANRLRSYFAATILCVNTPAWTGQGTLVSHIRTIDLSLINDNLRGFSDAIRVGRYAYFAPYSAFEYEYASQLVRINLGDVDIGTTIDELGIGESARNIVQILDFKKKDTSLRGYSGLFNMGQYIIFVPYRNTYDRRNGQRGFGTITRLDLNDFSLNGISTLDMRTTERNQVPSFADVKLTGFAFGIASGQYGLFVPFYNGGFHGKIARYQGTASDMGGDLQELDLSYFRPKNDTHVGYRGGFVGLWQGVAF